MNLLFLHGVNNTPASWQSVISVMEANGFSCRSIFLPPRDSIEAIAEGVLQDLGEESVYLVGHSFGGMVALAVAAAAGNKALGIALVNSSASADSDATRAVRADRIIQAEQGGYHQLASDASGRAYHPDNHSRTDLQVARQSEIGLYGADRFIAHQKAMGSRPDRSEFLSNYTGAKLAIIAEGDIVIPVDNQRSMAASCDMSSVIIPGAGHMLPMEKPFLVASALLDWLDQK
jgi:pimeloyl-ACP methyl ester carboxylesterase